MFVCLCVEWRPSLHTHIYTQNNGIFHKSPALLSEFKSNNLIVVLCVLSLSFLLRKLPPIRIDQSVRLSPRIFVDIATLAKIEVLRL